MSGNPLAEAVQSFKAIQQEMQHNAQTRQHLMQQISETEMVKEELGRLDEDATVFKLIGPAMIKQDLVEATTNVSKRLEYIEGELRRVCDKQTALEIKAKEQQQQIMKLQAKQQQQQQQAAIPAA